MLAKGFLVRCLTPETSQSLESIEVSDDPGNFWKALLKQSQSQQKRTLREVHHQLKTIKMSSVESLAAYQGRVQQLIKGLSGTNYSMPDSNCWGILTNGLMDHYRTCVRMINLSFEDLPYHRLIDKMK